MKTIKDEIAKEKSVISIIWSCEDSIVLQLGCKNTPFIEGNVIFFK